VTLQGKLLKEYKPTTGLNAPSIPSTKSGEVGRKLTSNRLGDLAEFYAVTWLWDNGFEVFPNAGCTGAVDMVGMKDGKVYLFDVKTYRGTKASHPNPRTKLQKELGVQYILFDPTTRNLNLREHKE